MINKSLNLIADSTEYVLYRSGKVLIPTALGAIGGWLTDTGYQKGAFQGLVTGCLMTWVVAPIENYVKRNIGKAEDKIHPNTVAFLQTIGAVMEVVLPILVTSYYADKALAVTKSILPHRLEGWMILKAKREFTFFWGIVVNIAPVFTQHSIAALRDSQKEAR